MHYLYQTLFILACFIVGYLFGSIPFSVIIGKYIYHKDPRLYGSKNPGGTNVGRVIGHKAAVITIILDILKVIIPFITAFLVFTKVDVIRNFLCEPNLYEEIHWYGRGNSLVELAYYMIPFGGFLGHSYSIFLKFHGGKIVSTYAAVILTTTYLGFPLFGFLFFFFIKFKKYVSLSSILTSICFMIYIWIAYLIFAINGNNEISKYMLFFGNGPQESIYLPILVTFGTGLLIFKHRSNIVRIINNEESKVTRIDGKKNNKKSS